MTPLARRATAEMLGTAFLVFFGCSAVIMEFFSRYGVFGIAVIHAVVLSLAISMTLAISGGHLNPAVTIGLLTIKRITPTNAFIYVASQIVGGIFGALMVRLVMPTNVGHVIAYGAPALSSTTSFMRGVTIEAVLTFLLMSAVLRSTDASFEEAAMMSGAGPLRTFGAITLRLGLPGILALMLLVVIRSFESFEVPALVGLAGNVSVLTTDIYLSAKSSATPSYGQSAAYSVCLLLIVVLLLVYPLLAGNSPVYGRLGALVLLAAIGASAWNIVGGYAGQVSVGHSVFFGVGAYSAVVVYTHLGWPPIAGAPPAT